MLKTLLSLFIKKNGRNPNNLEMILLRQKAAKEAVDERKVVNMFDRKPVDPNKPILGGQNIIETDEQILQRLKKGNEDSINRLKNKKDPPEELAGGGVAGLLGERTGYKDGKDVFIGPKRKKKTKKELEDEKILKEKIAAYLESQTINLPEEDPLKKYQPTDYSLYGGFMDNVKMKEDRTGNIINDFNNISIDPKDARVGISRFNPKTNSSFVAGAGPSGFNINLTKQFADGGPARQNFAMGKRAFLKFLGAGAAGIASIKTGLLGLGKKEVAKEVVKEAATSGGVPPYFFKLVNKIKTLGDNVTETAATADRQSVKQYKDYTLTEDVSTGSIEILKKERGGFREDVYMSYKVDDVPLRGKKKSTKTEEYEEYTARPDQDGKMRDIEQGVPDSVVMEVEAGSGNVPESFYTGPNAIKKAEGGRIGLFMGGGLLAGKGLTKEMLKFMTKGSANAKSPAGILKMMNPKQFEKLLDNPSYTGKISPATGETADQMILDMIKKTKEDRSSMIGDLIGSARKVKKVDDDIIAYKKKIIKDMMAKGINENEARGFADLMAKEMKEAAAPQLTSSPPKVTEQGLLELENIQKNLLTKGRQLQASGGLATMLGE